jgi:hypothetical protein
MGPATSVDVVGGEDFGHNSLGEARGFKLTNTLANLSFKIFPNFSEKKSSIKPPSKNLNSLNDISAPFNNVATGPIVGIRRLELPANNSIGIRRTFQFTPGSILEPNLGGL